VSLLLDQQIIELALHHRCDQPSLEARVTGPLSRRLLDGGRERDEPMGLVTSLMLQNAREIVGIIRQFEIEKDDARVVLVRKHERAGCAANSANACVSSRRQHARETSANQAVGDHDQNAGALCGVQVSSKLATATLHEWPFE
jgi:hypothetical protein